MATQTLNTRIALKSDTTANWAKSTLVLLKGEQAIEITESGAYKIKIGDGVKTFAELPYATMTPEEISALIGDGSVQNVTLASGTNNGTLKLTVDGTTTDNIAVKGLGSAAYTNTSAYATAAQGTLATNAVRKVVSGTANGTISVTTGTGAATDIAVKGLGSAAYKGAGASQGQVPVNGAALGTTANVPVVTNTSGQLVPHASGALGSAAFKGAETFATAAQGAKADKSVQSVSITSGTNNGTIKLTVNGNATDNIAVKGLGSAAYTASGAYATSAQGAKADAAMPKAGGTFTGTVTLAADPTDALQPTTKQYVDAKISSSIAASDAMVFKGTLGTNGTATALPTSSVVIGDTYKVITQVSVAADNSYTGDAVTAKVGDLVVAMSKDPKWIVVPSGNETVTTVKYSTTTQNLTTSAQSGAITVGEAATKQVDSSIEAASTSTKLPTSKAVAAFVEGKGYKTTDQKVKNTLNTTAIAPGNISFLYDAIKHMVDLGYDEINANCVYEKGWTPVHATVLYDQMKRISDYFLEQNFDFERDFFCSLYNEDFFQPKDPDDLQSWCGGVGNSMIACDPQGRIFPCIRYMESSLNGEQEPYSIGDVDNGIGCTECYKCRINCMAKIDRRTQSTDECFYCPIAAGCSNCSGYDYQVNGTPDSKATYICVMHKARALGNLYFWNKYYRKNNMSKRMKNYVPDEWALEIISESELNMLKELERED